MQNKFIVTNDKSVGEKMISNGFNLISNVSGTYIFVNKIPEKFNFESIDKKKIAYTNILPI